MWILLACGRDFEKKKRKNKTCGWYWAGGKMKGDEPIFSRWSSTLVIITQPSCISQVFSFQSLISWKFSTLGMQLQMPLRIWFCCGFFDPSVCPSLAWQLTFSPIYIYMYLGIYAVWIVTRPMKPYRFLRQVITRPDQPAHSDQPGRSDHFDWLKELSRWSMQNPHWLLCLVFSYFFILL